MKLFSGECYRTPFDDKSALVQVMAWCCQATSHNLSQCWTISLSPYGVTRPQWVDTDFQSGFSAEFLQHNGIFFPQAPSMMHMIHHCSAPSLIWTNAVVLSIGSLRTNFSQIAFEIQTFSFNKMHLKMSSEKCWPFCLGLNVFSAPGQIKSSCKITASFS